MAENVVPRVRVPRDASAGDSVSVRTLISHPMESGLRRDGDGNPIPRQIINRFTCAFNGEMVVDVEIHPGVSTNPYFQFDAVVNETGSFEFTWYDDDGSVYTETADITVA
ncbi:MULTISPECIES: thiosulfate oxidation carrier complex protein SoxZ [Roseicyclus]|jgi:sulfur-oxidizing protein SoxZ|uniref:thiosulfate oxidation carrier complex protein SoxZ n=1 Tax=Roseicyclus amphidinii TaxID=3034232 RepID=UPI0024E05074|nr:thiosulfate oxidation carrier complex protein SoxZ [Roseicyclus sp. Amp-Y-6]